MPSYLTSLAERGMAHPPKWLPSNVMYETIMGSMAYGCNEDESDLDLYGWCIPPKDLVFPHLAGEIPGFGQQIQRFQQHQEHHIKDHSAHGGKGATYDVQCYSVVRYFQLCMENNPNMVDSLFTPRECITHSTRASEMVRERRRIFLHKGAWHKFRGYAYYQLSKIANQRQAVQDIRYFEAEHKIPHSTTFEEVLGGLGRERHELWNPLTPLLGWQKQTYEQLWQTGINGDEDGSRQGSKRFYSRKRFGYDVKFAVHLVRLVQEVEQILTVGDIDLRRDSAMLRDIRAGNWTEQQVRDWFQRREKELEPLYLSSKAVPHKPDEAAIKALLLEVLEEHYGSLAGCVVSESKVVQALRDVRLVLDRCESEVSGAY